MHEHVLRLQAPQDRMLHLWFEPWAEGLACAAGTVVELRATSSVEGQLELDATQERTAVYSWPGSTLLALVEGNVVLSFEQPVPLGLTKEMVSMHFGPPPVPTQVEGAVIRKRPWWRFWA
jgi:hypothetical protein